MARNQPTPAFRLYEQQTAPRAQPAPQERALDVASGGVSIANSLLRAGNVAGEMAQMQVEEARVDYERRQDDARVLVARSMAQVRREANELRRTTLENAEDGWRGVTDSMAQGFASIRERALGAAQTPEAMEFMSTALDMFEPEMLDNAAEAEQGARAAWQVDTFNEATDTISGVINADPNQWDASLAQQLDVLSGVRGISADQRRGLEARTREQFALSAVSGIVEQDPRLALQLLRDPEVEGPFAELTGVQRDAFANRAQAELNRRNAEARAAQAQFTASLRDTINAQNQLLQRGIMPGSPVDPEVIARTLGPDVAQNYIANLASASAARGMADMPIGAVAQIAAGAPSAENSDIGNLVTVEARQAAERSLTARREDPGGYALQNGLMRHSDLMAQLGQAVQSGDWESFQGVLRDRGADALDLRDRGVVQRVAPLSTPEAQALGAWLNQQPAQVRLGFFSQAAAGMDRDAYRAMMAQIAPSSGDVVAYAGYRFPENPDLGRRLMRGVEILEGRDAQGERTTPSVDMPAESWLRQRWETTVGRAYSALGPEAQQSAYNAFRASYAARSLEEGDTSAEQSAARARLAIGDATGGVITWNGRETLMPPGMRRRDFEASVAQGFQQWSFLQNEDPGEYDLVAIGGGRYRVDGVRNPVTGRPVEIQVRR